MSKFLIITLFISISIAYFVFRYLRFKRKLKNEIENYKKNREYFSIEKLYEELNDEIFIKKDLFYNIINCIYEEFDLGIAGYLRLDDNLATDLSFIWKFYDEMKDIELIEALESNFNIKISNIDAENVKTVRDLIYLVNRKIV
ncbi:hypothetical protein EHQ47_16705 [Leptospira bourretii]|uniref:acyl carrier protein n=1 Tax=Leptospira bourretii TaxID=2484962 RepID=UPI001091290D|nr:hypothetical protein [Leptospira bourretii]TGL19736.1 hypothetical protein EHQ47_16705 [Leptospira bourretii]